MCIHFLTLINDPLVACCGQVTLKVFDRRNIYRFDRAVLRRVDSELQAHGNDAVRKSDFRKSPTRIRVLSGGLRDYVAQPPRNSVITQQSPVRYDRHPTSAWRNISIVVNGQVRICLRRNDNAQRASRCANCWSVSVAYHRPENKAHPRPQLDLRTKRTPFAVPILSRRPIARQKQHERTRNDSRTNHGTYVPRSPGGNAQRGKPEETA